MPDVYGEEDFDLVGCIVGVVDKPEILDGSDVEPGDALIGIPSTGLHTNGYTLARTVLFDAFDVDDAPDELNGETVGEALLRVHRSYLDVIGALRAEGVARAFAHVTGGGLPGNVRRVLPDGATAAIDYGAWERPALFTLIQNRGDVPEEDMRQTFNLGVGLVAVVRAEDRSRVLSTLNDLGETPIELGRVEAR
jgi:phosphoribosylformylglycinamidine cyclo-ligase